MKLSKQLLIALAVCITVMGFSCRKDKDGLPKATEEGKNTFGCEVDGAIFIPKDVVTVPITPGLSSYYDERKKLFHLFATEPRNEDGFKRNIFLEIQDLRQGMNAIDEKNKALVVFSKRYQQDQYFKTNVTTGGTLTITRLDTVANIISGTFSFKAVPRLNPGPNIHVTDGRFDITYQP